MAFPAGGLWTASQLDALLNYAKSKAFENSSIRKPREGNC